MDWKHPIKPKGFWTTAGDNLQHVPTAKEVKLIEQSAKRGIQPKQSIIEKTIENTISPFIVMTTSIIFPIANQIYTTSKEGFHPGKAYKREIRIKMGCPLTN